MAEQQLREVAAKVTELEDCIARVNTALGEAPPRPSPLDEMQALVESTGDLRVANGNLSAAAIAKVFGISLNQLARWLGRTRQALSKTPDADSLQNDLAYFERVARLRVALKSEDAFRKWLRTPNDQLDGATPLSLMANRDEWQIMVDYVEDALTGAPT